jgi:uncharacterized membrane protein
MSPQKASQGARKATGPAPRIQAPPPALTRRLADSLRGRPWRPIVLGAICLAGIGISIYLLIVHYEPNLLICHTGSVVNCEKVLTSPSSVILGIPVPIFGVLYFIAMAAVCIPSAAWRSEAPWLAWGRIAAVVVGMGMVIWLVGQEALVLHAICLWCTGVHILTFIMFLIVITGWEDTGYAQARWAD